MIFLVYEIIKIFTKSHFINIFFTITKVDV